MNMNDVDLNKVMGTLSKDQDMSKLFNEVNDMVKNGNIPDEMKDILSNISSNSNSDSGGSSNENPNASDNSIDFETILKMKSIIEKLNNTNDPRSNLLSSLKPYLKDSRKEKIDQYIKLFGMSKVIEELKNN